MYLTVLQLPQNAIDYFIFYSVKLPKALAIMQMLHHIVLLFCVHCYKHFKFTSVIT